MHFSTELATMVQLYIDALNSDGIPVVGSTWQRVLEATYESAVGEAVQNYQSIMDRTMLRAPMEEKELLEQHSQALAKSIERFQQATSLDAENTHYESYLNKLTVNNFRLPLSNIQLSWMTPDCSTSVAPFSQVYSHGMPAS